jgi:RecJ-like exonuclease
MERIVSHCGIICSDCPTFNATKKNDDVERKRVADLWTKEYGRTFKIEDINCDGCLTKGTRVFTYCNICEIRNCGQKRNVRNCAYCKDYKCEKLAKLHSQAPKLEETLEEIRRYISRDNKH